MKCKHCDCVAHKHGETNYGNQRYKCRDWQNCGKTFVEVVDDKKVFIINCPNCKKEIKGFKFGWYVNTKGERKQRYQCSGCRTKTVNFVREE